MEDSSNSIVEKRVELMVSPAGKNVKLRTGHFIKPSIGSGSMDGTTVAKHPRHYLSSSLTTFEPKKRPLEVKFHGWIYPQKDWKTWVVKMASLHESTWKKAGISEAIMNSTYRIERNNNLVFGVAEKWCHETKSFIFSWGEATITLEDVKILGGYSVLGSPVFTPVETAEMKEIREKLKSARKEIYKSTCKKACQYLWMRKFMHSDDSTVEHEAFLALWLSRFVLPSSFNTVVESVFSIAIHLARGTRFALAPAVLANIYRDLSWLKQNIVASTQLESNYDDGNVALAITLWSPLALVQVWIWERFLDLQLRPNLIKNGEPRFALWNGLNCEVQDVCSVLDSAEERFVWRPYVRKITNCDGAKCYGDNGMWILLDSKLDDELLSFARCLRVSELVGHDCIEQYLPHRVALQFGMDQDIPGCVPRSNGTPEIAWADYNKSVDGGKLYIPPRLFEADVTAQYLEWWKQSVLNPQEVSKNVLRMSEGNGFLGSEINTKKSKRAKEGTFTSTRPDFYHKILNRSRRLLTLKEEGKNATSDLGYPLKKLKKLVQYPRWKKEVRNAGVVAQSSKRKKKGNNASIPHEFPPKGSKGLAFASAVNNDDKNETTSASSLFKPLKDPPPNFVIQKDLSSSPFPPGSPPKECLVQTKGSVNEDKVTPSVSTGFPPKCVDEDEVTPLVPPSFHLKHNMVLEARGSVNEGEVTALGTPDFPPNHDTMEVGDSVNEGEVTAKKTLRPASKHDSMENMENKECRNDEKSVSYPRSRSMDPHDKDKLTLLDLEARIGRLERLVAEIKAARKG
ncbi:PREDICTED: uncharacterized protein LOC18593572 [Theobroma cacao]|uniref:Uncharacterized protein LOC18593572 n=1 Tax=Theobroma cacao TaxID=3641 RepID=A0AB32WLL9_THECC|nr:PREDICTED: uncharacterized protein LOC18593572 [Theobroma cacao]